MYALCGFVCDILSYHFHVFYDIIEARDEKGGGRMFRRILAVGDVHGEADCLEQLWAKIAFDDAHDLLVFLGDYIDRGPAPVRTLQFVQRQTEKYRNVHALMGNHEAMMLSYMDAYGLGCTLLGQFDLWLANGGKITRKQLAALPVAEAKALTEFVRQRPISFRTTHEEEEILFVHAGVNPAAEDSREDMLWIREEFFMGYYGDTVVVVGHTPTQMLRRDRAPVPLFLPNNIVACDTGSYLPDGRISCVDVARYLRLRRGGHRLSFEECASCCVQARPRHAKEASDKR